MKQLNFLKIFVFLSITSIIFSCTPLRRIIYVQNKSKNTKDTVLNTTISKYKLQSGDNLFVTIKGTDEKLDQFFNTSGREVYPNYTELGAYLRSNVVNDSGFITIPIIGRFNVKGKTITEATDLVQLEVDKYLVKASVIIKLVNFKISVLGEVKRPSTFYANTDYLNILQAIGLAGDLTDYGNRNKVKIIRTYSDSTIVKFVDISSSDLLKSEFYILQPNDIIYVEPNRAKLFGTNPFPITTIVSIISTTVLIYKLFQ